MNTYNHFYQIFLYDLIDGSLADYSLQLFKQIVERILTVNRIISERNCRRLLAVIWIIPPADPHLAASYPDNAAGRNSISPCTDIQGIRNLSS
jgi:hypothetical protein